MQEWPNSSRIDEVAGFAAVAEHGSFVAAARALGRDASVLSRRVSALERRLGIRLLERSTRRVAVTEAGAVFLARARAALTDLEEAEAEAQVLASRPRGLLRLALPASFGRLWVAPILPAFLAAQPHVRIDARLENRSVDLIAEGFDAAVRIGALPDSGLVARRIAPHRRLLCAAPGYLAAHGVPGAPEELAHHACLGFTGYAAHPVWRLERDRRRVDVRISGPFTTDDGEALVPAAVSGLGIALVSDWLVGRELTAGTLVPVLEGWTRADEGAIHVVVPSGRLLAGKTRAFVDWMVERFARAPPWLRDQAREGSRCPVKKRSISREASGPVGSV